MLLFILLFKGFLLFEFLSLFFFFSFLVLKYPIASNLSRFKIIGSTQYTNVTQVPNTHSHYFALHTHYSVFQFFFSTSFSVPSHAHLFLSIAKLHTSNFSPQKLIDGCSVEPVMRFKFVKSKPQNHGLPHLNCKIFLLGFYEC